MWKCDENVKRIAVSVCCELQLRIAEIAEKIFPGFSENILSLVIASRLKQVLLSRRIEGEVNNFPQPVAAFY